MRIFQCQLCHKKAKKYVNELKAARLLHLITRYYKHRQPAGFLHGPREASAPLILSGSESQPYITGA
ncbi:hypothetical protein LL912_16775 [Niabella sp. CC-SYL272]|uniref:hypothetical protein n=1 Tax=Niabella agricola TaxID=2891571 RepID=UPI001F40F319|nr:hypothetical protein [Niabella agricola]MCF3110442.1 hypothetical protein [Niabella agricola]